MPTTLQPLNDGDEARRVERIKLREEESRKWERLGKEVEERRKREDDERRKHRLLTNNRQNSELLSNHMLTSQNPGAKAECSEFAKVFHT